MADRAERVRVGELESFEQALRAAHDHIWWREFVGLIRERRLAFVDALVSGEMDQRSEDRTRGQISELNFILSLDMYASQEGKANGRPST